jgi:uncharacterized protein YxeA
MTVAKNLQQYQRPGGKLRLKKSFKKNGKKVIIGLVIISILLGVYGIFNLIRLAPGKDDRQEVVLETGDQPLEQKITIYVDAPGGLNMREAPSATSKILKTIPNGTKLEASLLEGEWYKVIYDGQTGYVNQKYVKTSTETTTTPTTSWQSYQNSSFGYSISYPGDWVKVDYGANQAARLQSYVGFGAQLSDKLDSSVLPPVAVKVTNDPLATVQESYQTKAGVTVTEATIAGAAAKIYVFTASSGVQMTAYVVGGSSSTYILEESGGYASELAEMAKNFKLNG